MCLYCMYVLSRGLFVLTGSQLHQFDTVERTVVLISTPSWVCDLERLSLGVVVESSKFDGYGSIAKMIIILRVAVQGIFPMPWEQKLEREREWKHYVAKPTSGNTAARALELLSTLPSVTTYYGERGNYGDPNVCNCKEQQDGATQQQGGNHILRVVVQGVLRETCRWTSYNSKQGEQ
ncbi:hypothetical protein EXIGLDRAFT_96090 [Exidia glandulosa HHB12029]|uniref:Uncharacterized protein n=1 Tax=Exidia glandulosa HHB12029 TaxID=1314781 RepID=A0A165H6H2_EXIGL|nr:hypothetical protein EXIGLDRAFT_96090 [Exidia glandulosa HHB12029]